jgi:hypothetical protein
MPAAAPRTDWLVPGFLDALHQLVSKGFYSPNGSMRGLTAFSQAYRPAPCSPKSQKDNRRG